MKKLIEDAVENVVYVPGIVIWFIIMLIKSLFMTNEERLNLLSLKDRFDDNDEDAEKLMAGMFMRISIVFYIFLIAWWII